MFILFGDAHHNNINLCEDSSLENQVYRPEFLKLFCDILAEGEKIDFYIEGGSNSYYQNYNPG